MIAAMGEDPSTWRVPMGYFLPSSKAANDAGMDFVRKQHSVDEVRRMLEEAKYGGDRMFPVTLQYLGDAHIVKDH